MCGSRHGACCRREGVFLCVVLCRGVRLFLINEGARGGGKGKGEGEIGVREYE